MNKKNEEENIFKRSQIDKEKKRDWLCIVKEQWYILFALKCAVDTCVHSLEQNKQTKHRKQQHRHQYQHPMDESISWINIRDLGTYDWGGEEETVIFEWVSLRLFWNCIGFKLHIYIYYLMHTFNKSSYITKSEKKWKLGKNKVIKLKLYSFCSILNCVSKYITFNRNRWGLFGLTWLND